MTEVIIIPQLAVTVNNPRDLLDLAAAAAGCYENFKPTWTNPQGDVSAFLSEVRGAICIGFEGSHDALDWLANLDAIPVPAPGFPEFGDVHQGLYRTASSVIPQITAYLAGRNWPPCYVAGHSKGAGEAIFLGARLKAAGHPPLLVAAFEPPRVGGPKLRAYYADMEVALTQTRNAAGSDIVTLVPPGPVSLWCHPRDPVVLRVPDSLGIIAKHQISAVITGLAS